MVKLGFHLSISKGFAAVPEKAVELGCTTFQIFSRNPRGWESAPLKEDDVADFIKKVDQYELHPFLIHMPYLPNFASEDKSLYKRSVQSLIEECDRAAKLKADYINIHMGRKITKSIDSAFQRVENAVNTALEKGSSSAMILLENTAGQGTEVGVTFEEIKRVTDNINYKKRVGVCLDTAHLFGAGYDLRNKKAVEETIKTFDKIVGLKYLKAIHYNDSNSKLNSHVDRHQHIGKGEIGAEGMNAIINCKLIDHVPFIMETPMKNPGEDLENIKTAKSYLKQ
ncbi:MAG: deoxyribonuclease IV [Spirochaetes bacterium]|nr:deoxyribonuclease IV [Spirochaetota bacterium]